ncbi:Heme A synthase, cytochrome oxidase biogenesis protein Cox15-CtaA [Halomonas citrativorans]|uniref:Heme A synthase, cytochrome oxidase biogenesis protein Cox15-CtaA n=1 Tax=Halomonas citrativorans TaxID=2742612 RepID=A0A1R4I550_9GAMM|nr:COX15/CtaA family protein [Halomonas citrativorans]SJN14945.1 Heme A synthase, cytochrome oxidase biogenesis protein Cox15-CtaA [Halomonas citrativorans]
MHTSTERRLIWLSRLTLLGTLLTIVVILVGAWTRLVDAGLGCPDWPGCYGRLLVPDGEHAALRHPDAPLDAAKAWVEMVHRYIATLLGLLVLSVLALGWPFRNTHHFPWSISVLLLAAIIIQGAFGAFTVTLKLWPQVVTLHLLGGLSVLLLFFWLHLRLTSVSEKKVIGAKCFNIFWGLAAGLLILQLGLGGWVTSNYSGMACQGFPACNGQWWPHMDLSEGFHLTQTVGPNYLHGQLHAEARVAIHYMHRLGALLLGVSLLMLWYRYRHNPSVARALVFVIGVYALQVVLGIANVLMWLPLWLALAHTAGAVLLVIGMLWAWRCVCLGER